MSKMIIVLVVAILIEALIEYFKSVQALFEGKDKKAGITQLITIVLGIVLAFAFGINLFSALDITVNATLGIVLTGILISRGSNYMSDLIKKLQDIISTGSISEEK